MEATATLQVDLLGGFRLGADRMTVVPTSVQRLVAYLAVRLRPHSRPELASVLWPYRSRDQAAANLRKTLWQERLGSWGLVESNSSAVRLVCDARVDFQHAIHVAYRLLSDGHHESSDHELLADDLLPTWPDSWARFESARWHELRLASIEVLSERLLADHNYGAAANVALIAVSAEPWRERPRALLIRAHLANDDQHGAERAFAEYRRQLKATFRDLAPSERLQRLLQA